MTTQAVFSSEFYQDPFLFYKDHKVERTLDGNVKLESSFLSDFWKYRNTHALIDGNGTIGVIPFAFFDELKRYFTFEQDPNLIAVHQKIKHLEDQIQNPLSPELQALRQEVHQKGWRGVTLLKSNLGRLSECFEKANEKSAFTLTLLKIVNFIRSIFQLEAIQYPAFTPIDMALLEQRIFIPAMQLTPQESTRSQFFSIIENHSPFQLPAELTPENMQKLEYGLLDRISFELDQKRFSVKYDQARQIFVLTLCSINQSERSIVELMQRKENYCYRSDPFNVIERKSDGTIETHSLQSSFEFSYTPGPWYNPFDESFFCRNNVAKVDLSANCEYNIPLSQGNFTLKLFRRVL
jgi:hypothetical protein